MAAMSAGFAAALVEYRVLSESKAIALSIYYLGHDIPQFFGAHCIGGNDISIDFYRRISPEFRMFGYEFLPELFFGRYQVIYLIPAGVSQYLLNVVAHCAFVGLAGLGEQVANIDYFCL